MLCCWRVGKGQVCIQAQPIRPELIYPCFCSMKQQGVNFHSPLDGMLHVVHHRDTPILNSLVQIDTPGWKEALLLIKSVLPKNTPFCETATYQSSFFNCSIKLWNLICKLIRPCDFLNIKIFKNSITNMFKDELADVFDPDKPCSWGIARNCGCHWQQ